MVLRSFSKPLIYIILILLACLFLIPVYVILVTSVKPLDEVTLVNMWKLPSEIDFSSYGQAFLKNWALIL